MITEQFNKELNDVMPLVSSNLYLQTQGVDVAIPYIAGSPGGGKTACIKQMANNLNWGLISTHFALKPLEETGGIPQFESLKINGETILGTIWSFPDIMKHLYLTSEKYKNVIWLLDDIHLCGAVHMALLYELLTERKLREYVLPKNVSILLAGNHGDNKAGAKTMFSAIINRVCLFPVYTSHENWKINFAIKNKIHQSIISFFSNSIYEQFFHESEQVDSPWASPRSWTRFSNIITHLEKWNKKKMNSDELLYIAQGHVSKEAASEFVQYYKIIMNFNVPNILKNINDFEVPENSVNQYALASALCTYYTGLKDPNTMSKPFAYIVNKYIDKCPDLAVMIIHDIIDIEKILNRRNLYFSLINHLNTINPGITTSLLKELTNV